MTLILETIYTSRKDYHYKVGPAGKMQEMAVKVWQTYTFQQQIMFSLKVIREASIFILASSVCKCFVLYILDLIFYLMYNW